MSPTECPMLQEVAVSRANRIYQKPSFPGKIHAITVCAYKARDHRSPLVTPRTREPSLHHNLLSSPKGEESMVVEQRPHPPAPEKRRPPVLPPSRRIAPPSRRIAPPSERLIAAYIAGSHPDSFSGRVRRSITSGSAPFNDEFPEALMLQAVERKIGLHRHKRAISEARVQNKVDTSCSILGVQYNLGETIGVASNVCLECRCAAGSLYCSPKCCFNPAGVSAADAQKYLGASSSRTPRVSREHPLQHLLEEVGGLLNR
ncbi:unnamed protein product [Cyprideis torosa]|uniref:Uncharacterized protein n=1 Tax=Cyprideis torosa TaxID=163714 RepID=A0A7R8WH18_9CRUS|nr:unnamed protein product [Cyprideis torosa]CAG0893645.1 unnamed protein product [Cyprideis torosa]